MIINSLKLKAEQDRHDIGRFHLEQALRAASQPAEKLIIVRKVSLGKLDFSKHNRKLSNQVQHSLTEKYSNAVHASQTLTGSADVVWFRSIGEARQIFLYLLITGQQPIAWFWRLAIEDWRGGDAIGWLDERVRAAGGNGRLAITLGRELLAAARRASGSSIAQAFGKLSDLTCQQYYPAPFDEPKKPAIAGIPNFASDNETPRDVPFSQIEALAGQLQMRRGAREIVDAAILANNLPVATLLMRLLLSAVRPDHASTLVVFPYLAIEIVKAIAEDRLGSRAPQNVDEAEPLVASREQGPEESAAKDDWPTALTLKEKGETNAEVVEDILFQYHDNQSGRLDREDILTGEEQHLSNAGLLLIVPTLSRLGLEQWIDARRNKFKFNFAAHLIAFMASQYAGKKNRPIMDLLDLIEGDAKKIFSSHRSEFHLWSKATDNWLRKKARRRLHDLARRGGWASRDAETLNIRFSEAAADIRLRRLALDVDPGWVSWLGRTVHYHFSDDPLDGNYSNDRGMVP
ncbi:hypothetical protein MNBD_ALPHA04-1792 [hydrothermal vent metagenome]|uniref:Uncharacterized protein n=1 Tax=hydrothermal vent metagenome TaxID=652676 RepID=A0A3B0SIN2_9ZZZZ